MQLYLDQMTAHAEATVEVQDVLLFSGGIDSLGGLVKEIIGDGRKVAVVSHRSASKRIPTVDRLISAMDKRAPQRLHHVPVWATKKEDVGREYTQRTRSFLYAALAASVAQMLGLDRIQFYENGVTRLNLPITPQLVGARASRTTHPQALNGFAALLSILLDKTFRVDSPFLWLTKGDVLRVIRDRGCADLVQYTVSCSRIVAATKTDSHCGRCSQCIDRRFAALAVGLTEEEDPPGLYKVQLMTDARVVGETRTMAESFLHRALALRTMDELAFQKTFPEATRAYRHVGLNAEEAVRRIHDLHVRHGNEVHAALTEGHRRYAAEFQAGTLPDSCVLVLGLPDKYRHRDSESRVPTFRQDGDHWRVWFENEATTLKNGVGPRYLALLLANPGRSMHAIDMQLAEGLLSGRVSREGLPSSVGDADEAGHQVSRSPASSGGPATDRMAVLSFRGRLDEVEEEAARARAAGNPTGALELEEEAEQIRRHLRATLDLRGNPRPTADDDERARQAVMKAVSRTITRLWTLHPFLARHLRKFLSTAEFCLYAPDPVVSWVTD